MSPILHARPLLRPWKRNLYRLATWNSLLYPSAQDTHMVLPKLDVGKTLEEVDPRTSSFTPLEWTSQRLPSRLHLTKELPYKMHQDLRHILNEHCRTQAGNLISTPSDPFSVLRHGCTQIHVFDSKSPSDVTTMATYLYWLVCSTYHALTGEYVSFDMKWHTDHNIVVTDEVYRLKSDRYRVKILWDNMLLTEFNQLVGELMDDLRHGSRLEPYSQTVPTKYKGYKATLGK
ncbi:hypothetical protein BGW80DRAFT_1560357, partial [Lactifluus volemus]